MNATSLGELLLRSVARVPNKTAILVPDKDTFLPITYQEMFDHVRAFAGVFRNLGVNRGDRVVIMSENCVEWTYADWACQCLGACLVPIYPTLPADQASYIPVDCGAVLGLVGSKELRSRLEAVPGLKLALLKGSDDSISALAEAPGVSISESEIKELIASTGPEDLATIIYTSGTTGEPKGVMLPHRAPVHICEVVPRMLPIDENDVFLSFLPQSHVFERIAGQFVPVALGGTIAFAKNLASLQGDMVKVRPTIMFCVPRFLESFHDRVLENVAKAKPIRQKLFRLALAQGVTHARGGFAPLRGLLDHLVMSKIRERTGGRLKFFISGGAALPPFVSEFYLATGLTVLQGYGLTETTAGTFLNRPERNKYWTVGEALDMEAKIAEDGEILIKGAALMTGYYNKPKETAEAIDPDGWFHTGDIGEFEGTFLKITDRKKDLLVLANGKNVAPQPIENRLRASALINEAVLFGDGMDACVALILPNQEAVRKLLGMAEGEDLKGRADVHALIKKEIDGVNKQVANFEMVKRFAILDSPFSIESGELTPTLKVKRKVVRDKYADLIKTLA